MPGELKAIREAGKDLRTCMRTRAELLAQLEEKEKKLHSGQLSRKEVLASIHEKHYGYSTLEWMEHSERFLEQRSEDYHSSFNALVEKGSDKRVMVFVFFVLAVLALQLFAPGIIGFVTLEGPGKNLSISYTASGTLGLDTTNAKALAVQGIVDRNFTGSLVLVQGNVRYPLLNITPPERAEVENSSLEFELREEDIADGVMGFKADNPLLDGSAMCALYTITSLPDQTEKKLCFGSESCCSLHNLAPEEDAWNATLFLNKGK